MPVWLECINCLAKKRRSSVDSPLLKLQDSGLSYTCKDIYLGKEGLIIFPNESMELRVRYTVRDGLEVQIKTKSPHRIIFNYVDGSYYANDQQSAIYDNLANTLTAFGSSHKYNDYSRTYMELEEIIYRFIKDNYFPLH